MVAPFVSRKTKQPSGFFALHEDAAMMFAVVASDRSESSGFAFQLALAFIMSTTSPTVLQSASVPSIVPTTAPQVAPGLIVVSAAPPTVKAMVAAAETTVTVAADDCAPTYLMTIITSVSSAATDELTAWRRVPRYGDSCAWAGCAAKATRAARAARVRMRLVMVMFSFPSLDRGRQADELRVGERVLPEQAEVREVLVLRAVVSGGRHVAKLGVGVGVVVVRDVVRVDEERAARVCSD